MNKSQFAGVAKKVPGVKGIVYERERLNEEVERLQAEIKQLNKQNEKLKHKLGIIKNTKTDAIWQPLKKELLKINFDTKSPQVRPKKHAPPYSFNWVVLAANVSSGGQGDIFRTIEYLTEKGHDCAIYVYDVTEGSNQEEQKKLIATRHPKLKSNIFYNAKKMRDCDAIFATHWVTAYPVYNFSGTGKKYYYIQDFEPFFEPAGYRNHLAEQTYKFGFRGITLGSWLAEKIGKEYGMECEYFNFGFDPQYYRVLPSVMRKKDVLYYMRPQTARRGAELALMSLELFHKKNPQSVIHLFGSDIAGYNIPFPYVDHGVLDVAQLNELYNKCAAGLVLSFTNMSLLPMEMLAAGCIPVVNDAYHTRQVEYTDAIVYADPSPKAVADALSRAIRMNGASKVKGLAALNWDRSNEKIEEILMSDLK